MRTQKNPPRKGRRSQEQGETGQEPGRYQPRDPPAHGAAYARDGDRDRDRQDAQQAEGKISRRQAEAKISRQIGRAHV